MPDSQNSLLDLIADARAAHVPGQSINWKKYEELKRRLKLLVDPTTDAYEHAHKQLRDAMETGK
jgi:hypothetical protein